MTKRGVAVLSTKEKSTRYNCQTEIYRNQPPAHSLLQRDSLNQLSSHFSTGLAVNAPTLSTNVVLTHLPAIFAAVDTPLPRLLPGTTTSP